MTTTIFGVEGFPPPSEISVDGTIYWENKAGERVSIKARFGGQHQRICVLLQVKDQKYGQCFCFEGNFFDEGSIEKCRSDAIEKVTSILKHWGMT
jgi:hypothetical protein